LPAEHAILEREQRARNRRHYFASARLAAIETELRARGVDDDTITAHRFGIADHATDAAEIAERHALTQPAEAWMAHEAAHFSPEDF
jgi:hypothetical protein